MVGTSPRLVIFTEQGLCARPEVQLAPLLDASPRGAVLVIVRDKYLSFRERSALAERLRIATERSGQHLGVAGRIDLALALDAKFLHLAADGIRASDARRLLPQAWISRALHDGELVSIEEARCLDALVISPVVEARKGRVPLGVRGHERFAKAHPGVPLFALGGVTAQVAPQVLEQGWDGVVVQGAALKGNPLDLVRAIFG
jgi:thiamine-phosphate diphosphorylase